jgi:hypothetical protein
MDADEEREKIVELNKKILEKSFETKEHTIVKIPITINDIYGDDIKTIVKSLNCFVKYCDGTDNKKAYLEVIVPTSSLGKKVQL